MGILEILFWIYAFWWKSLLMFPLWIALLALLVYLLANAIKNRKTVLVWIVIMLMPILLWVVLYVINDRLWYYYSYTYPIMYLLIIYKLYKYWDD